MLSISSDPALPAALTAALIGAWVFIGLTVPVLAMLRMLVREATFTPLSFSGHIAFQAILTAGMLWLTSLFGPLDTRTVVITGALICAETLFRLVRQYTR